MSSVKCQMLIPEWIVGQSTTLITGILEELDEGQTHGMDECSQDVHEHVQGMSEDEDDQEHQWTKDDIVGGKT